MKKANTGRGFWSWLMGSGWTSSANSMRYERSLKGGRFCFGATPGARAHCRSAPDVPNRTPAGSSRERHSRPIRIGTSNSVIRAAFGG